MFPASIASAAIGMIALGGFAIFDAGGLSIRNVYELFEGLLMAGWFFAFGLIAATFVVGWYLVVFGLPVALLLGDRIRHPLALAISLIDATAGALVATTGARIGLLGSGEMSLGLLAAVLCFALPAGFLYRRNVIAMRDVDDFN